MNNFNYKAKFFFPPFMFLFFTIISLYYTEFSFLENQHWLPFIGPLLLFIIVPILDIISPRIVLNPINKKEEDEMINDETFDFLVLLVLPIQIISFILVLYRVYSIGDSVSTNTLIGWTLTMGMSCGIFGINVGHELGHRINSWHRFAGKTLLWSSLRMTFYIEHNWGHHSHVSTPEDLHQRKNGMLFGFLSLKVFF